jgi:protein ImuA
MSSAVFSSSPAASTADTAQAMAPSVPVARVRVSPECLHPDLWLGHQLGRHAEHAVPSGYPVLDAQLPGRGWPRRVLTELLLPHAGVGEIRLLSSCLVTVQQAGRLVMMFDPPQPLSALALSQLGLDLEQLLVIHSRSQSAADPLWALEQALRSGHVGAVLVWLPPRLRAERLRRLQLAAQAHDGPAFAFRELAAQERSTAASLRLALHPGGADALQIRLLKRRGPPLEAPLHIDLPPVLPLMARRRALSAAMQSQRGEPQTLHTATFINLAA